MSIASELVRVNQRLDAIGVAVSQANSRIITALPALPSAKSLVDCDLDAVINEVGELSRLKVEAEQLLKSQRELGQGV